MSTEHRRPRWPDLAKGRIGDDLDRVIEHEIACKHVGVGDKTDDDGHCDGSQAAAGVVAVMVRLPRRLRIERRTGRGSESFRHVMDS